MTRGRRITWRVAATLVIAGVAIAGAASASSRAHASSSSTDHTSSAPKSLTVAFPQKINSLDPDGGYNVPEINAIGLWGEGLYEFRYGHASAPQPGLAASAHVSNRGLTWTFVLRKHLKFSDGTPLTAHDVQATLTRDRTNKTNVWGALAEPIKSVSAPNPTTVVVHLSRPYPVLKTILAESGFSILPASAYSKPASYMNKPVSAGPYMIKSWGGGYNSTYVANPNYWGPKPVINTINFTTVPDFNTNVAQLKTHEINMAEGLPMSVQPQFAGAKLGWRLEQTYGFYGLTFDNKTAPMSDVRVRKAVSHALNRDQINQIVWRGYAKPLAGFWPTTMSGYDPSISTNQNTAAAKKLLAGTACANGCTLELDIAPLLGGWATQLAQVIASNLSAINIKVNVTNLSNSAFLNKVVNHQRYQMAIAFEYDFANIPNGMLEYAALPGTSFAAMYSDWADSQLTAAVKRANTASAGAVKPALAKINRLFVKDQPYATLATFNDLWSWNVSSKYIDVEPTDQIEVARAG
jgi:ABC-type transport system substrate-binding protein